LPYSIQNSNLRNWNDLTDHTVVLGWNINDLPVVLVFSFLIIITYVFSCK
jgi:hypothetical protein